MNQQLIYLEWADAVSNPEWKTEEEGLEWAEKTEWVVCQVGWLLKETPKYLYLASRYSPQEKDSDPLWGQHQKIPKTWIIRRKTLKV